MDSSSKVSDEELQASESCTREECIQSVFTMKALNQWVLHGLRIQLGIFLCVLTIPNETIFPEKLKTCLQITVI